MEADGYSYVSDKKERKPFSWDTYRVFVVGTALLHGVAAVAILILGKKKDWPITVCASYSSWKPLDETKECFVTLDDGRVNTCSIGTDYKYVGKLSPILLLVGFSALSFCFQILPAATAGMWRTYRLNCESGLQPLRWIEYSLSSSLMVLVLLILNGNYDLWILLGAVGMNWITMMCGLLHEHLLWAQLKLTKLTGVGFSAVEHLRAHVAGWVVYSLVWTIIIAQFTWSIQAAADAAKKFDFEFPQWIKAIIWIQFVMFSTFGLNQVRGVPPLEPLHEGRAAP